MEKLYSQNAIYLHNSFVQRNWSPGVHFALLMPGFSISLSAQMNLLITALTHKDFIQHQLHTKFGTCSGACLQET